MFVFNYPLWSATEYNFENISGGFDWFSVFLGEGSTGFALHFVDFLRIMRHRSLTGTFVWCSASKAILRYTFLDKARHAGNIKVPAASVARKRNDHI